MRIKRAACRYDSVRQAAYTIPFQQALTILLPVMRAHSVECTEPDAPRGYIGDGMNAVRLKMMDAR